MKHDTAALLLLFGVLHEIIIVRHGGELWKKSPSLRGIVSEKILFDTA